MEFEHAKRFCEVSVAEYFDVRQQIKKLDDFMKDYEKVKLSLTTLLEKCTHGITVPMGKYAFMLGSMVHTNDALVLLGDNWFAEQSVKQTVDIINRRIKELQGKIDDLQKRLQQISNELSYVREFAKERSEAVEIIEPYDEEHERQWNAQHEINVREQRKKAKQPSDDEVPIPPRLDNSVKNEQQLPIADTADDPVTSSSTSDDDDDDDDGNHDVVDPCSDVCRSGTVQSSSAHITFQHSSHQCQVRSESGVIQSPADIYTQCQRHLQQSTDTAQVSDLLNVDESHKIVVERYSSTNQQEVSTSSALQAPPINTTVRKVSKFRASRQT